MNGTWMMQPNQRRPFTGPGSPAYLGSTLPSLIDPVLGAGLMQHLQQLGLQAHPVMGSGVPGGSFYGGMPPGGSPLPGGLFTMDNGAGGVGPLPPAPMMTAGGQSSSMGAPMMGPSPLEQWQLRQARRAGASKGVAPTFYGQQPGADGMPVLSDVLDGAYMHSIGRQRRQQRGYGK